MYRDFSRRFYSEAKCKAFVNDLLESGVAADVIVSSVRDFVNRSTVYTVAWNLAE